MYLQLKPYEKIAHLAMIVCRPFQADGITVQAGSPEPASLSARARKLLYEQRWLAVAETPGRATAATLASPEPIPVPTKSGKRHKLP